MSGSQSLTPVWVVAEAGAAEATLEALGEAGGAGAARRAGRGGGRSRRDARDARSPGPPRRRPARAAADAGRRVSGGGRAAPWRAWLGAHGGPARSRSFPHTRHGLGAAAHLTVRLDAALAPEAVGVRRDADGGLEITRPAYGERLYATVRVPAGTPAVVTLRPGRPRRGAGRRRRAGDRRGVAGA